MLVVTVFAGAPDPGVPLSPFAQELHARWGHPADAVTQRREEDRAALAILGAELAHWPHAECIYRRALDGHFPYASEEALWGEVHPTDGHMIAALAARLASLPVTTNGMIYAPLGAGHHVDHQIVRQAAEACGHAVTYYEDFPYAGDSRAVQLALGKGPWKMALAPLPERALEAKIAAIGCYRSQLSTFWTDLAGMATNVRAFAAQVGQGRPSERYWRLSPT